VKTVTDDGLDGVTDFEEYDELDGVLQILAFLILYCRQAACTTITDFTISL
jgi:hypothetical protein